MSAGGYEDQCAQCGRHLRPGGDCWSCPMTPDLPCERCVFIETPGGKCICREVGK